MEGKWISSKNMRKNHIGKIESNLRTPEDWVMRWEWWSDE